MKIIIYFFSVLVPLLAMDAVWLNFVAKRFYESQIGHLMGESFKLFPAGAFYVLYALGLTIIILIPAIGGGYGLLKVFGLGALLGAMAYGAYDLTNHATLKGWPLTMTIVDMAWGAFVTGAVVTIAMYLVKNFNG